MSAFTTRQVWRAFAQGVTECITLSRSKHMIYRGTDVKELVRSVNFRCIQSWQACSKWEIH